MAKLYVEKPRDEYGNRAYIYAVIEAEPIRGGKSLRVIAPREFAEKWPTVSPTFFQEVGFGAGPARIIQDIKTLDELLREIKEISLNTEK